MKGIVYSIRANDQIVEDVVKGARHVFGTVWADLASARGAEPLPSIRSIIFNYLREEGGLTWASIGTTFGKDHSTVVHAIKRHNDRIDKDSPAFDIDYKVSNDAFLERMIK